MTTLFKRSNGFYYLKWIEDGKETRISLKTTNKKDALDFQREYERTLYEEKNTPAKSRAITFADALTAYREALAPHKKAHSIYCEAGTWNLFAAFCSLRGVDTLQRVRPADVAAWIASLVAAKHSPHGINTRRRLCCVIWNHLLHLEITDAPNPFSKVPSLKAERKTKFLPWDDVLTLVESARAHGRDIHLVFILGAFAGLRKGEILNARWEHVDFEQGRLWVEGTKSSASRDYVPLHQTLRDALAEYRQDAGYIVAPDKAAGKGYRWTFAKRWARAVTDAGITATPHTLRHSVATHLLDIGYTLQQVAVFLRHASDIPTRRYADLRGVKLDMDKF